MSSFASREFTTAVEKIVERMPKTVIFGVLQQLGADSRSAGALNRFIGEVLPDELHLTVGEETHRFHISTFHEFEQFMKYDSGVDSAVLRRFVAVLGSDDVVWDVGANVGVHTVVATATCPADHVIAVEPYPSNVTRIRENLTLNGRDATLKQLALADSTGSAEFGITSPDGRGAFGSIDSGGPAETLTVETVRGDELLGEVPRPTILKMDIQGAELAALRGLCESLSNCRVVYCNVYRKHHSSEQTAARLSSLLNESGFEYECLGQWDGGYFLRAARAGDNDAETTD